MPFGFSKEIPKNNQLSGTFGFLPNETVEFDESQLESELQNILREAGEDDSDVDLDSDAKLLKELEMFTSIESSKEEVHYQPLAPNSSKSITHSTVDIDYLFDRKIKFEELINQAQKTNSTKNLSLYEKNIRIIEELIEKLIEGQEINLLEVPDVEESSISCDDVVPSSNVDNSLVTESLIIERIKAYKKLLEVIAFDNNPSNNQKILRYKRAIETLEELTCKVRLGKSFDISEIPPMPEVPKNSESPSNDINSNITDVEQPKFDIKHNFSPAHQLLVQRHKEYRVISNHNYLPFLKDETIKQRDRGNMVRAAELMRVLKVLDSVVPKILAGEEEFDPETDMPPPPEDFNSQEESVNDNKEKSEVSRNITNQDPSLTSVVSKENLEMRIIKHNIGIKHAQEQGDRAKANRLTRVVERHKEAIVALDKGLPFAFQDLASPPGCPPLDPNSHVSSKNQTTRPRADDKDLQPSTSSTSPGLTIAQRKAELLRQRQAELKAAAAKAKGAGKIDLAKKFLGQSLGMRSMIQAAEAGLAVDMSQLPPKPCEKIQAKSGVKVIEPLQILSQESIEPPIDFELKLTDCNEDLVSISQLLTNILNTQAYQAEQISEKQRKIGASAMADALYSVADISRRSTSFIVTYQIRNKIPDYHFVTALLPIVNKNVHLDDNILEFTVVRCLSLPLPTDVSNSDSLETFVTLELPYPDNDKPQKHSTGWGKSTNPEFFPENCVRFPVTRKAKSFARFIGMNTRMLKATVYYKRGIFKNYGTIGSALIPLNDLKNYATIEKSIELMTNRRAAGGIVSVRVQQRSPLEEQQESIEKIPWLLIKNLPEAKKPPSNRTVVDKRIKSKPMSINLLDFEYKLLGQAYNGYMNHASADKIITEIRNKMDLLKTQREELIDSCRNDDFFQKYRSQLPVLRSLIMQEAKDLKASGQDEKAQKKLEKAKKVQEEINHINTKPL